MLTVIIGGPAGCALAAKLAWSPKRPRVALVEGGKRNDDVANKVAGQRWATFKNEDLNFGYKTTPQEHCNGRQIDYSRGKVLGGSSAINFGAYTVGARDDYNEWASVVGDDFFRWDRMQARFKDLETFDGTITPTAYSKYAAPKASDHGSQGRLRVSFASELEPDLPLMLDIFREVGIPSNPDHNSGDPIGMAMVHNTSHQGKRVSATDLLEGAPGNLTIITEAPVQRVILQGRKAIGVESQGRQCTFGIIYHSM